MPRPRFCQRPSLRFRPLRRRAGVAHLAAARPHVRNRFRAQNRIPGFGFEPGRHHHRLDDVDQKSERQSRLGGRQLGDVGDDGDARQHHAEDQLQAEQEVPPAQTGVDLVPGRDRNVRPSGQGGLDEHAEERVVRIESCVEPGVRFHRQPFHLQRSKIIKVWEEINQFGGAA